MKANNILNFNDWVLFAIFGKINNVKLNQTFKNDGEFIYYTFTNKALNFGTCKSKSLKLPIPKRFK